MRAQGSEVVELEESSFPASELLNSYEQGQGQSVKLHNPPLRNYLKTEGRT
jgi:hypothetical protein